MKKTLKTITSLTIILQLLLINPIYCQGAAPLSESPSITHMAEISDLVFTGKVVNITITTNHTYIQFNNLEYIKNPQNTITFTLQLITESGGHGIIGVPTFEQDIEYLVFLIQDVRYHVAYGEYGRIPLTEVDPEALDSLRFVYDPSNKIRFQGLMIYPRKINPDENVSITFMIGNNQDVDDVVGFIIEHHPPAYLIIDESDTSLKYFQFAKSVSMSENRMIYYKFDLTSNYTGVNTIVVTQEGSQVLVGTFTVNEIIEASSSSWTLDYSEVFRNFPTSAILVTIIGIAIFMINMFRTKNATQSKEENE